jgi:hypothetical protein
VKKIFLLALLVVTLNACTDNKAEEKALLNDVIKIHDKVMMADEALMKNKMQLDTISKQVSPIANDNATIKSLSKKLVDADTAMENWMHKFDPDFTGKSHDDIMNYLNQQKKQIVAIDSQIKVAVNESDNYLKNIKRK